MEDRFSDGSMVEWSQINVAYTFPEKVVNALETKPADRQALTEKVHKALIERFVDEFPYVCQNGGVIKLGGQNVPHSNGHIESKDIKKWLGDCVNHHIDASAYPELRLRCGRPLGIDPYPEKPMVDEKPKDRWCYPRGGRWFNREIYRLEATNDGTNYADWNLVVEGEEYPMIVSLEWECPFK